MPVIILLGNGAGGSLKVEVRPALGKEPELQSNTKLAGRGPDARNPSYSPMTMDGVTELRLRLHSRLCVSDKQIKPIYVGGSL